eukprot:TRINITY_DN19815_c0_g1_i3.p1 TRINITY_DN19815_c0_g1~~TRINITY_DN19815_c0_g1_i3.p1  ORF type:complete len:283 (+),score=42.50 TRINITY_DN19815_c0_g1_i3:56-850(+)
MHVPQRQPLSLRFAASNSGNGLGGLQTGLQDACLDGLKPFGEQRPVEQRRVLGDLSNTQGFGGLGACKRPLLDPRTPQPARRSRAAFEVFTGGENDASGPYSVSRPASSPPRLLHKSRTGDDPFSFVRTPAMVIEELQPLASQEMLPDVDGFAECPPDMQEHGRCWQALWEDGPEDPVTLAEGLGISAELADREARQQDSPFLFGDSEHDEDTQPVDAWPSLSTPKQDLSMGGLFYQPPSPPSAVPAFRMDIDFDMDEDSETEA